MFTLGSLSLSLHEKGSSDVFLSPESQMFRVESSSVLSLDSDFELRLHHHHQDPLLLLPNSRQPKEMEARDEMFLRYATERRKKVGVREFRKIRWLTFLEGCRWTFLHHSVVYTL